MKLRINGINKLMLTVKAIRTYPEFVKLRKEWDDLASRSGLDCVFVSFDWLSTWIECLGENKELMILTVRDGERLIGAVPLMKEKNWRAQFLRRYVFVSSSLADFSDFLTEDHAVESQQVLFGWLADNRHLWDIISLERIPKDSMTVQEAESVAKTPFRVLPGDVYPVVRMSDPNLEPKIQRESLRLKKGQQYFRERGALAFSTACGDPILARKLLDRFFDLHCERWRNSATPSMFENDRGRSFFLGLARAWIPDGKMEVYHLDLDGTPIAVNVAFNRGKRCLLYSAAYDPRYSKGAPGYLILRSILMHCLDSGIDDVDFLRGGEDYKLEWASEVPESATIELYSSRLIKAYAQFLNASFGVLRTIRYLFRLARAKSVAAKIKDE